jgi:anti-sigma B factor antagonist
LAIGVLDIDPSISLTVTVLSRHEDGVRIAAAGELDLLSAAQLQSRLDEELDSGQQVELDVAGITFVDSTGLRVFVQAAQRAAQAGLRFALLQPLPAQMRRVLQVTGLDQRLPIAAAE